MEIKLLTSWFIGQCAITLRCWEKWLAVLTWLLCGRFRVILCRCFCKDSHRGQTTVHKTNSFIANIRAQITPKEERRGCSVMDCKELHSKTFFSKTSHFYANQGTGMCDKRNAKLICLLLGHLGTIVKKPGSLKQLLFSLRSHYTYHISIYILHFLQISHAFIPYHIWGVMGSPHLLFTTLL